MMGDEIHLQLPLELPHTFLITTEKRHLQRKRHLFNQYIVLRARVFDVHFT